MIIPIKTGLIENAATTPKRYFGKHFADGVATYHKQDTVTYVSNEAARRMNKTFEGKPLFVYHNSSYEVKDLEKTMDGVVVRSFFNPADGDHWAEFMVTTDKGHEAILKGWGLSNAYRPTGLGPAGTWQGNKFDEEILDGEYHHLAIVPDPRYESQIMTPEQFKIYNDRLNADLEKVTNSLGDNMFKFFKKDLVQNSQDFSSIMVELPKSGRTLTVENALTELDEKKENSEEFVKLQGMYDNAMKRNSEMEKEIEEYKKNSKGKKNSEEEDEEEKKKKAAKENSEKEEEAKKAAAKENSLHNELLKENSHSTVSNDRIYTSAHAVQLGKERYSK